MLPSVRCYRNDTRSDVGLSMPPPTIIHLFNVSEDEAQASIAEHGEPRCTVRGCGAEAVLVMLLKPPSAAWGQQIKSAGACVRHRAGLQEVIDQGPGAAPPPRQSSRRTRRR